MVFLLKIHFIRGYYIGKIVLTVLIYCQAVFENCFELWKLNLREIKNS